MHAIAASSTLKADANSTRSIIQGRPHNGYHSHPLDPPGSERRHLRDRQHDLDERLPEPGSVQGGRAQGDAPRLEARPPAWLARPFLLRQAREDCAPLGCRIAGDIYRRDPSDGRVLSILEDLRTVLSGLVARARTTEEDTI